MRLCSKDGNVQLLIREAEVASGFILLLLIGILIGFVISRMRKRVGLAWTWSNWVTTVIVVGFILLLMWVTAYKH
jgi:hypothetical protein